MDLMMVVVLLIVAIIIMYGVHISCDVPRMVEEKEKKNKNLNEYLKNNNIISSVEYTYMDEWYKNNINLDKGIEYKFIIDENNKNIHIINKENIDVVIPFREITGCEIITDSQVTGGVGRAVVGSVLAGGTGAIVGAVTAKPHVLSYKIVIYRENIQTPYTEIVLINEKKSTKHNDYICAVDFANKINASIKAIISTVSNTY